MKWSSTLSHCCSSSGITFINSVFGIFSGLINLFSCVVAMAVAFGFAEPASAFVAEQGLHPAYALPVCFVGLYFVTLMILRLLADQFIRGNVRVPMSVDWAGGAACGFLIGMISVGRLRPRLPAPAMGRPHDGLLPHRAPGSL